MRFIGWLLGALLLILVGWIGGPVAMASYRVATASDPDFERRIAASALLDARSRASAGIIELIDPATDTEAVRACGYDPDIMLRETDVPFLQTVDWTLTLLNLQADRADEMTMRRLRSVALARTYSAETMTALATCLDSPLKGQCLPHVEKMSNDADKINMAELTKERVFSREQTLRIKCIFLDGAADRRGIAKSTPAPNPAP
ncbi:hypothetical protein FPZ54_04325 [Sphingomonas suaedae]|uniref:Uncharacterized protein n=1 Tax=Sphingomonas suaedae TaxID=2599297 RepID=A0A518RD09_9SPHN|nr:hypothetical protein [Sphingomonas suaedae]QDX25329.1 hypothetical protein FPZ54_04325 [Sphingomonas suaedae]